MKTLLNTMLTIGVMLATSYTQASVTQQSELQFSKEKNHDHQLAHAWGLKTEEWQRYRQLMEGPLGIYSPGLDPLTALGIEARSVQERERYAELQVRTEAQRVEKILSYQRAYDAAWQRLAPQLPRVSLTANSPVQQTSRLAVFVRANCQPCIQQIKQLQAQNTAFDIYVVGKQSDGELRAWAGRAGIDPEQVRTHLITLNHDAGRWQKLGISGDLPAILRKVNTQWQRQ